MKILWGMFVLSVFLISAAISCGVIAGIVTIVYKYVVGQ